MTPQNGLEGSCAGGAWVRGITAAEGVELLQAAFRGVAYAPHRHDTYAIGVTDAGVQQFDYRGATQTSLPGRVVALHPDERHDGRAGTPECFAYRMVYVAPARIAEAVRAIRGRATPLPFAREPVLRSPALVAAVDGAFRDFPAEPEPLALDALVHDLARGLLAEDASTGGTGDYRTCDTAALERARQFLAAECTRVVTSAELERVTGLARYALARQFRQVHGTSPYRYLLMRRLERVRSTITGGAPLAETATEAGFADQAHMARHFKAAYGLTPAAWRRLLTGG